MALLVRRDCGLGSEFFNYVRIEHISFHIGLLQDYKPFYLWDIELACYLNKEAYHAKLLKTVKLPESRLPKKQLRKYREAKVRAVNPVATLRIETVAPDFRLKDVDSVNALYTYFYNEIKKNHLGVLGVRKERAEEDVIDDLEEISVDTLIGWAYGTSR